MPPVDTWQVRKDSAYLHLCSNETIGGVEFMDWPDTAELGAPDACRSWVDASSHFLSRPMDVTRQACCTRARRRTPARRV